MTRLLPAVRHLFESLAGRLALILVLGVAAASAASLLVAERTRIRDFRRARLEQVVASTSDIADRLARDPVGTAALLHHRQIFGAREATATLRNAHPLPELDAMLAARLGPQSRPQAISAPGGACYPDLNFARRAAGMPKQALPTCAYVSFTDVGGRRRNLSVDLAPFTLPPSSILDLRYLLLMLVTGTGLSFLAAGLVSAPLRRLTRAARVFSVTLDPEPIPERGPREIRAVLSTFNLMQHRVREGFRERTHILASIAHDLQTPLTRMRLRVEQVGDAAVREKLIADLAAMQQLVRNGLELARSSESREDWVVADIDSILSSVAEDAVDIGHAVRFDGGCGAQARVKASALVRCLTNLVDNAVKYGGDAELGCALEDRDLVIRVRDHGPGLDDAAIGQAFQPFRRFATDAVPVAGTGLGLAIAQAQARSFGATLTLKSHPDGGLLASLRLPETEGTPFLPPSPRPIPNDLSERVEAKG